jgi:uncharacterized repeat protein (TIGR01451 family)
MRRLLSSGSRRYALLLLLVGAGSLALMGNSCAPAPTKPPAPASADLSVTKTDTPDPVVAGSDLTYTITVANAGPSDAQNVGLSDAVPAGTTFVAVAPDPAFTCTTPPVGETGTVSCNATNAFPSGAMATFTLAVHLNASAPPGLPISNHATVSSDAADPNPDNNTATEPTNVVGAPADLSVTNTDSPDPVAAGSNLTYTITVSKNGPNAAQNVTMSDGVQTGTTFVSFAQIGFSCFTPPVGEAGGVTCLIGALPSGATATFTLVVHVNAAMPAGATMANTATSSTSSSDPTPGNNTATTATTVAAAS